MGRRLTTLALAMVCSLSSLGAVVADSFERQQGIMSSVSSYVPSSEDNNDSISYEVALKNGEVDIQKVFYGAISLEKKEYKSIGFVDYEEIVRNTPEYKQIKEKKIDKGTGNYWIHISRASDRAVVAITSYAKKNGIEFVAEEKFMPELEIKFNGADDLPDEIYLTNQVIGILDSIDMDYY